MVLSQTTRLIDEITDFLATNPTPQQIIEFHISADLTQYAYFLLGKHRQGTMSAEERAEMEEFARMDNFITILKAKTRLKLPKQK